MNILIAIFSFILILLCLFTLLVIMVQKPKGDGGMGAALGGGSMEAAFGAETGSLLTKITRYSLIGFFVLTFALYLGNLASRKAAKAADGENLLTEIVDESAAVNDSGTPASDSSLQQLLQLGEEAKATTGDEAADLAKEIEAAGESVKTEAGETTNP
jgi:preprotein translocase subunit SecG